MTDFQFWGRQRTLLLAAAISAIAAPVQNGGEGGVQARFFFDSRYNFFTHFHTANTAKTGYSEPSIQEPCFSKALACVVINLQLVTTVLAWVSPAIAFDSRSRRSLSYWGQINYSRVGAVAEPGQHLDADPDQVMTVGFSRPVNC